MVAMTSGSTPWRSIGSTTSLLNSTPSTSERDDECRTSTASQNGTPNMLIAVSTKNAGSMTNSPWAKLIVCDVCHSS